MTKDIKKLEKDWRGRGLPFGHPLLTTMKHNLKESDWENETNKRLEPLEIDEDEPEWGDLESDELEFGDNE